MKVSHHPAMEVQPVFDRGKTLGMIRRPETIGKCGYLAKEGSQLVTNCNQLKMPAAAGKSHLTPMDKYKGGPWVTNCHPLSEAASRVSGRMPGALAGRFFQPRRKAWNFSLPGNEICFLHQI